MKIKRKGLTLNIFEDDIESPREYYKTENITHMICFHNRLMLGDEHNFKSPKEFQIWCDKNKEKVALVMPLYLYNHSGIDISTSPFNDPWDSGQVGYIYVDKNEAYDKGYTEHNEILNKLDDEVFEYSKWISNYIQYYSYEITDENDEIVYSRGVYSDENGYKKMILDMKKDIDEEYKFLFNEILNKSENYL